MPPTNPQSISVRNQHFGVILILLFVSLLFVGIGIFLWSRESPPPPPPPLRPTAEMNNEPESTTAEAQADALLVLSTSNELNTIVADIEGTATSSLLSEFTAIEAELSESAR